MVIPRDTRTGTTVYHNDLDYGPGQVVETSKVRKGPHSIASKFLVSWVNMTAEKAWYSAEELRKTPKKVKIDSGCDLQES